MTAVEPIPAEATLLTAAEHEAVDLAGQMWNRLCQVAGDGPARAGDLSEMAGHIHAIQRAVLKNAAARAYPDRYRLLGGHPPGSAGDANEPRCDCG